MPEPTAEPATTPHSEPTWDRRPLAGGARARDFHLRLPPDLEAAVKRTARARGLPAATWARQLFAANVDPAPAVDDT